MLKVLLLPLGRLKIVKGEANAMNFTSPELLEYMAAEFIEQSVTLAAQKVN